MQDLGGLELLFSYWVLEVWPLHGFRGFLAVLTCDCLVLLLVILVSFPPICLSTAAYIFVTQAV